MTEGANRRRRLIMLTSASTKLEAASNLIKGATIEIARLFPVEVRERVQKIGAEIDAEIERLSRASEDIP